MKNWFETVVKYDKTQDDGIIKTVSEKYLVDAVSFTEAEAFITHEMKPFMSGEFIVSAIKRTKIAELFESSDLLADRWYSCKVNFIVLDEDKGVEKKLPHTIFIQAGSVQDADKRLREKMETSASDYEIELIKETKILDVFKH